MNIEDRVKKIEQKYVSLIEDVLILKLTDETLKIILKMRGGATLRVSERWKENKLFRYSYYWLDSENNLKIGWDNAPHHKNLETFPHHKHLGEKLNIVDSHEKCLEDVMDILKTQLTSSK